jgi:hypothetical protein
MRADHFPIDEACCVCNTWRPLGSVLASLMLKLERHRAHESRSKSLSSRVSAGRSHPPRILRNRQMEQHAESMSSTTQNAGGHR